jgi:hypothetical protein
VVEFILKDAAQRAPEVLRWAHLPREREFSLAGRNYGVSVEGGLTLVVAEQ